MLRPDEIDSIRRMCRAIAKSGGDVGGCDEGRGSVLPPPRSTGGSISEVA